MEFEYILALSIVLTIVFFSSGITILNSAHRGAIERFGRQNKISRYVARALLTVIDLTAKARRAWIRMISPGSDLNS